MATCAALVPGRKGECLRPVPEDAPIRLCLVHQWVVQLGGAQAVAAEIRKEGS
ncbi:hypothetical protein [Parafrigoribacterium humi]|uniref:hypothetical protein n=1 Tax=Parafrigoribacterium humi TaxID=3144664 RepID=UPI0032F00DDD